MTSSSSRHGAPVRRSSVPVVVGGVKVGGAAPVVVQSMTNTDTADVAGTAKQVAELARAGSELVRITVDKPEAAAAVPRIRERLDMMGIGVPLIGDFHYNGHKLLEREPACAEALAKYRINPGNVGFGRKKDTQFAAIVEFALKYAKPVRIGANWGSLDQAMMTTLMDENHARAEPWDAARVGRGRLVEHRGGRGAPVDEQGVAVLVAQPDPADVARRPVDTALQVEAAEDQPLVGSIELRDPLRRLVDHCVTLDQAALVLEPAAVLALAGQLPSVAGRLLQLAVDPVDELLLSPDLALDQLVVHLCRPLGPSRLSALPLGASAWRREATSSQA